MKKAKQLVSKVNLKLYRQLKRKSFQERKRKKVQNQKLANLGTVCGGGIQNCEVRFNNTIIQHHLVSNLEKYCI